MSFHVATTFLLPTELAERDSMKDTNRLLANQQGVGTVRVCDCGSINLNIGAMTLHMSPDAFIRTAIMIRQAANEYVEQKEATGTESEVMNQLAAPSCRYLN
jgi:hypothetical protein